MNLRLVILAVLYSNFPLIAGGFSPEIECALDFGKRFENKIYRSNFTVHWLPDGKSFWYRVQTGASSWEHVLVDAESGKISRGDNAVSSGLPVQKISLLKETSIEIRPSRRTGDETRLRFNNATKDAVELYWINFQGQRQSFGKLKAGESSEHHTYAGHRWLVADARGEVLGTIEAKAEPMELIIDGKGRKPVHEASTRDNVSGVPWQLRFEQNQIVLYNIKTKETTRLTNDGTTAQPYRGPVIKSPDGASYIVFSVKEAPPRQITLVESTPKDQTQPRLQSFDYRKPGDELPHPRPVLVHHADQKAMVIDDALFKNPFTESGALDIRWSPHGEEFYFDYNQRGHQLWRILAVNAQTGAVRVVVEEKSTTFIDYTQKTWRHWLDETHELLWMSERDGWCHLWLYDTTTGAVKNQVTRGSWVVRKVLRVDETSRQVWFLAGGLRTGEDPYHQHLCRVNFDGSGLVQLTEGDGNHEIAFSPNARFFTDRWSRADHPPVTELRRSEDGKLVCELERGDAKALLETGWKMPQRFVAKGRDGNTDIHGVIILPSQFDSAKMYPVIEEVYAGPHGAFAPKTFGTLTREHTLAELGFIVVKADGMGTNHRGKVFHDVAWKNLRDAGFPDRIAWIKAAAATRPWMDLSRVGIWGGSAGGQSAMRALLDHHDFYKAAFADCGCHDNRMDKIWWNEQWMGWPIDGSYARASNVTDAAKLEGALMLCVGELDHNVDPASTMQVVSALEKAGKTFELLVIAGTGHGAAETHYGQRRRAEFFVRNLLGK